MIQPKTKQLIKKWCPEDVKDRVTFLMEQECTTEVFYLGEGCDELLERIQLAVIRESNWDTSIIRKRIQKDSVDFRDLLMARGFGELDAHLAWWKEAMRTGKIN